MAKGRWAGLASAGLLLLAGTIAHAQGPADDDGAERPGLVASFFDSDGDRLVRQASRIEPGPGGDWGPGAPDARVRPDRFVARWRGLLRIQSPGPHRFFARITNGQVGLKVAGVEATDTDGRPRAEPIVLPAGLAPIEVAYRHAEGPARLAIDWEGPGFAREPLPTRLLFHEPDAAASEADADRFEEGRRLADRLGCASCHRLLDLPAHPDLGPPLDDAGRAIEPAWLAAWLANPADVRPAARMPAFGAGLSAGEVADLAAFLGEVAGRPAGLQTLTNEAQMALNVADPVQGRLLFRSVGCLGCHSLGGALAGSFDRAAPDLADLGRKRTAPWLTSYLARPKATTPSRHRADLQLSPDEAAHLAAYLVSEPPTRAPRPPADPMPAGDARRGRALADRLRCAACHAIPGLEPPERPARLALGAGSNPRAGCLAEAPTPGVPRFALTEGQRAALRRFVGDLPRDPSPTPPQTLAADAIGRRNCLGCHARDGRGGTWLGTQVAEALETDPALGGRKGTLTPPDLSAVGDKLRSDYLEQAIRGRAPTARPWLSVRMPIFPFPPGEAEAIAALLRGQDRMAAEDERDPQPTTADPGRAALSRGAALIGQRGFGCLSCHVLDGKIPPGGEPETLGPDLALAHRRMTERYVHRWVANPQRIIPGTPMPQFLKPVESQPGTLDEQLDAIWQLLRSPRLAEVAAVSTRERLTPQGGRALVVRDMVLLPGGPGGAFNPRGLAIGLEGGHALLFDADRLAWLAWWRGGFLYRTKSGRLWEWHPEGERLWTAADRAAPVVFVDREGRLVRPAEVRGRFGSFTELDFNARGVVLRYRLNSPEGTSLARPVEVEERIEPAAGGWTRTVRAASVPEGYRPMLALPVPRTARPATDPASLTWDAGGVRPLVRIESGDLDAGAGVKSAGHLLPMPRTGPAAFEARIRGHVTP